MIRPADRAGMNLSLDAQGDADLAERFAASQRPPVRSRAWGAARHEHRRALPFGRGANAPLAGRTILQIVPPLSAGGDERATLAVTAALTETGARALVATDSGELAGELQAIGGLFIRFPAATKNPLAMTLNMRRLQRIIASERVDLVHARSRWAAWAAVRACRKAKRPLVTSLPGDGGRSVRAPASRRPSPRATMSSRRPSSPPGAPKASFLSLPSASGSCAREWISPSFSRNG